MQALLCRERKCGGNVLSQWQCLEMKRCQHHVKRRLLAWASDRALFRGAYELVSEAGEEHANTMSQGSHELAHRWQEQSGRSDRRSAHPAQGYSWAEDKEHCEEYGRMLAAGPAQGQRARQEARPPAGAAPQCPLSTLPVPSMPRAGCTCKRSSQLAGCQLYRPYKAAFHVWVVTGFVCP